MKIHYDSILDYRKFQALSHLAFGEPLVALLTLALALDLWP